MLLRIADLLPAGCRKIRTNKIVMQMKMMLLLLLITCLQLQATVSAQQVTLRERNAEIVNVFKKIRQQTRYLFVYDLQLIKEAKKVNLDLLNVSLEKALEATFSDQPFTYTVIGKTVVIKPKEKQEANSPANVQDLITVSGIITDQQDNPLQGVSVSVKGTKKGAQTGAAGQFSIKDVESNSVLSISYVGFEKLEVPVQNRTGINVKLSPAENALDEMVVVAYGKTSKRLNTGSVSSISSATLASQPVADPIAAMQGRVPGLVITATNGQPGASFQVRIRGENSMKSGNDPLYIIDGVPFVSSPLNQFSSAGGNQSPLASISPNDIERIDILKDADATAIYGSRAANGVVLITTKKGKSGKTQVNMNIYTGFSKVTNMLKMLNTEQYLAMRKQAFANDGVAPTVATAPDLLEWDQNAYTDWQKLLIGNTAKVTEAQASVSGGNAQTRFLLSSTFRNETTVMPGNLGYKRGSVLLNADHSSKDGKFNIAASVNLSTDRNNSIPSDVTQYFNLPPNYPIYDKDGELYWFGTEQNPLAYLERTYESRTNNLIGNAMLRYTIIPGLQLKTSIGYSQMKMKQVQTLPQPAFNPINYAGSQGLYGTSDLNAYIVEPQLDYNTSIGSGKLNVLVGASWQESVATGNYIQGSDYSSDALLKSIASAKILSVRNDAYSKYHYNSIFGRVTYNWDQKYILNGTFRRDGSARFGPGKRFGNFGAVGAAWLFSNEKFVSDALPFLSFGKLRASYGTTGNDQIGDYKYLDSWVATSFPYSSTALGISGVYNPHYGWEVNKKAEVALELGFLQDRVLLTTSYYNNRSDNQLVGITLSPQAGFSFYIGNHPALVENSGWEFELSTINFKQKDLTWNTSVNLTIPKNKLLRYPGLENSADASSYIVGQSIRLVRGYDFLGVDPNTGLPLFLDVNKNGSLSEPQDFVNLGDLLPAFYAGLNNEIRYKDFQLSFFFQYVNQEGPMIDYGPLSSGYGAMKNKDLSALERWSAKGDITGIPRASATSTNKAFTDFRNYYRYSDAEWGDASFLRLKNISLRYDLSKFTKRWNLDHCSIYVQAQNVFTVTNYVGIDPEIKGFDRANVSPVNPFGSVRPPATPVLKTFTAGVRFSL